MVIFDAILQQEVQLVLFLEKHWIMELILAHYSYIFTKGIQERIKIESLGIHIINCLGVTIESLSKLIMSLAYLLMFNFITDAYFRNTGLERSEGLAKDLEWFREQDIEIPDASTSGVSYAKYLEELAERSAPLFLSHFYNIYFSHIAGGQVIARQVCINH